MGEQARKEYLTLPGQPNGLLVNDYGTGDPTQDGMWKVSYVSDETPYCLTRFAFARRSDAERARAAIQGVVDWNVPMPELIAQLREGGWNRQSISQMMIEAMQW